jgi:hypothetical protein
VDIEVDQEGKNHVGTLPETGFVSQVTGIQQGELRSSESDGPKRGISNHPHISNPFSPSFPIWPLGLGTCPCVFPEAELPFCVIECVFPQLELTTQSWWRLLRKEASGIIDLIVLQFEPCWGFGQVEVKYRRVEHVEDVADREIGKRPVR